MRFAPPDVFSAIGATVLNDPDLPDGRHLRFMPAPALGPPLGPIAVWRAMATGLRPISSAGNLAPASSLPVPASPDGARVLAASVASGSLAVLDGSERLLLQRSAAPAIVATPRLDRLRPGINGAVVELFGLTADRALGSLRDLPPEQVVALPLTGATPWYAGAITPLAAMDRVRAGAPKRQTVLEAPSGAPKPLTASDEATRVAGAGDANLAQYGKLFGALFAPGDPTPPASRSMTVQQGGGPDGPPSSAALPAWGTLAMQAVDYGAARYLGLGTVLKPAAAAVPAGTVDAVMVLALFALPADALLETVPDGAGGTIKRQWVEWSVDPDEATLIARMVQLVPGLGATVTAATKAGLAVRAALTAAAVPPLPDAPDVGAATVGTAQWVAAASGPSVAWRQRFGFPALPGVATGVAMASTSGGAIQARNRLDPATGRRLPMLVGRDGQGDEALAFDRVEAAGPVTYQFAVCEMFGRYGPARNVTVPPPARPKPPRPVPQVTVVRASGVPLEGAASPGTLSVTAPVPTIEQLAAGARPITGGLVELNGTVQASTLAGNTLSATIALPPLVPMATGSWVVSVGFTDADHTSSLTADVPVTVTDGRAPPVLPSGPGLVWSSRPANTATVEAALRWNAAPGSLFNLYEASAASLQGAIGAGAPDGAGLSRAAFAQAILQAAPADGFPRTAFARLNSAPVAADASGTVRYAVSLPRAQRTVVFVRAVSVSPGGVESALEKAGLVPLAVPEDLPPPAPRVGLAPATTAAPLPVAADGTAVRLLIEATGLDLGRLAAAFPGQAPEFRLRRTSGGVNDPLYAVVLASGALTLTAAGAAPMAVFGGGGLKPFVSYTWWAEVRMPAEAAIPSGVAASPHGLQGEFAWQQAAMPALWSRLSAPFSTVPAPQGAPAKLLTSQVGLALAPGTGTGWKANVALTGLPVAATGAVGPYTLRFWAAVTDGALARVGDVPIAASSMSTQVDVPAGKPVRVWIAVVDPLGREGEAFRVEGL